MTGFVEPIPHFSAAKVTQISETTKENAQKLRETGKILRFRLAISSFFINFVPQIRNIED